MIGNRHQRIPIAAAVTIGLAGLSIVVCVISFVQWAIRPASVINGCKLEPNTFCPRLSIEQVGLSEINLTGANLSGAQLANVDLQGANLRRARLDGTRIENVNLYGANLQLARLDGGRLENIDLRYSDLRGALIACNQLGPDSSFYRTHAPNGSIVNSYAEWQVRCRGLAFPVVDRELGLTAPGAGADALRAVDKLAGLDRDAEPGDLVSLSLFNVPLADGGNDQQMRYDAAAAFAQLVAAARHDGYSILPISGYRSYAAQEALFAGYVQSELGPVRGDEIATADAVVRANRYSAMAGHSEHQLGTVIDVSTSELHGALDDAFAGTAAGKWLVAHADEYGFVFSYPEGKENLTGYMWEPWHLRWVGPPIAHALVTADYLNPENGLTLARYLATWR